MFTIDLFLIFCAIWNDVVTVSRIDSVKQKQNKTKNVFFPFRTIGERRISSRRSNFENAQRDWSKSKIFIGNCSKIRRIFQRLRSEMINYISSRFDEFSSEMKQTKNLPSIHEIRTPTSSVMSNGDLASINKLAEESANQTIASSQKLDLKK